MANGTILYRQGRNVSGGGSRILPEVLVADFACRCCQKARGSRAFWPFVSSRSSWRRVYFAGLLTFATIYSSEFSQKRSTIRCVGSSKIILPPSTTRTQSGRSLGKRAVQTPGKG